MDHDGDVGPSTVAWVTRQLAASERIVRVEDLHGGISAEVRKLTVGSPSGDTRNLVLRTYDSSLGVERANWLLTREASTLSALTMTEVQAPELIGVDPTGTHCEDPSLLVTYLEGRTILDDEDLETRVSLLARQLVAIHRLQPSQRPPDFEALSTADTAVVPTCGDAAVWAAAIDVIGKPRPSYDGRFLHRDFQPGNVLFSQPHQLADIRLVGVIDWAGACWGPVDLDVAHCCTNLALLHGPDWGLRFARAYEDAGGLLAKDPSERLYWLVRDALAASEEVPQISQPWREAGRTELTTLAVERRLDAYLAALMATARWEGST